VDPYRSEEEQIRALRDWWKENGSSIMIAVGLAVALVFGWQWWQKHTEQLAGDAAALYQELMEATEVAAGDPLRQTTAEHLAGQLRDKYPRGRFADYASLLMARIYVDKDDLPAAEKELRTLVERLPAEPPSAVMAWINARLKRDVDPQLGVLARLRLARVLSAQSKHDEALTLLGQGDLAAFAAEREELRGDILLAKGDRAGAKSAYAAALEHARRDGTGSRLLELKQSELSRQQGDAT
jgi:predicted negative regulator of RcsB-dependent stress response